MKSQHTCVVSNGRPARRGLVRGSDGAQLLEFALVLPMLLVIVFGAADFGAAWALKDKLSNAARDAARIAASQTNDLSGGGNPPPSVTAVKDVVANYLTNAKVTTCPEPWTVASAGTLAWQYTSSSAGCGDFLLKIERGYTYTSGSPAVTIVATRVTLTYPMTWTIGRLLKLMIPSSTLGDSIKITTTAVMQNLT
jgi:Flp pilus assembly protein TadG